MLVINSSAG